MDIAVDTDILKILLLGKKNDDEVLFWYLSREKGKDHDPLLRYKVKPYVVLIPVWVLLNCYIHKTKAINTKNINKLMFMLKGVDW